MKEVFILFVRLPLYFCIFFPMFFPFLLFFMHFSVRTICLMGIISNIVSLFIFCVYIYFLYKNSSPAIYDFVTFFLDSFQVCGFFIGLVAWIVAILFRYLLFFIAPLLVLIIYFKLIPKLCDFYDIWVWKKEKEKEEKKK